jgi:Ser/Thr protein kinase RdoA (MazF antagonist)
VTWLDAGYPLIQTYLGEDLAFDAAGARAFYQGYTDGQGFTDDEWDLVFAAAVLHALRYLPWGDTAARWKRLLHAVETKADLISGQLIANTTYP